MISVNTKLGILVKRPSAIIKSPYVGDIIVENEEKLGHCPSLGLGDLLNSNSELLVVKHENKKTDYYIHAVKEHNVWVGNVPLYANKIVKQLLKENILLQNVDIIKPEYKVGDSKFDFYVKDSYNVEHIIEVKSVHIKESETNAAIFPVGYKTQKTAVISERAIKHVEHLTHIAKDGKSTMLVFVIQRNDCKIFKANAKKDPTFANALKYAKLAGVQIKAIYCDVDEHGIRYIDFMEVLSD